MTEAVKLRQEERLRVLEAQLDVQQRLMAAELQVQPDRSATLRLGNINNPSQLNE